MPKQMTLKGIDGVKNDIRVMCTGAHDSEDAGVVEGVPLDPPDDSPGWVFVMMLLVEHDTVQEKGEKGTVITRKTKPAYHQLWVRPKTKVKKAAATKATRTPRAQVPEPTASTGAPELPAAPPAAAQAEVLGRVRASLGGPPRERKVRPAKGRRGRKAQSPPETPPSQDDAAE